jgi:predicted  nucleic acid-binding Zn-ribbon protein
VSEPPSENNTTSRLRARLRGWADRADEAVNQFVADSIDGHRVRPWRREANLRVFVSYRREAGPGQAHRLASDLEKQFGGDGVFFDEQAIPAGAKFDAVIRERAGGCDVLLAVIGPGWLDATRNGERRLLNPDDYVRREIEAALERRVPVIPVALPGATLPEQDDLPGSLRGLRARPALAVEIPSESFWVVTVDSLARWLLSIRDEKRRRDKALADVAEQREKLQRELENVNARLRSAQRSAAEASTRRAGLDEQLSAAQDALARQISEAGPPRAVERGIRVLVSSRADTAREASRLESDLVSRLGTDRVLAHQPAAEADPETLRDRAGRSDALLAMIGPQWECAGVLTAEDPIRQEIEAALERGIPIIPLLIKRSELPGPEELPESLRPMCAYQALLLPDQFWTSGFEKLSAQLERIEGAVQKREDAVAAARDHLRELEKRAEQATRDRSHSESAAQSAETRAAALEADMRRVEKEEDGITGQSADESPAFLAGPPAPRTVTVPWR